MLATEPTTADTSLILERFARTRALTDRIREPLGAEDCVIQSMPDTSPTRWHLAHTTWFFEQFILTPGVEGYEPFHPAFSFLFNSYYNTVGAQFSRPNRGLLSRPGLAEVLDYRRHVDEALAGFVEHAPPERLEPLLRVIELGIQHEQQHQELMLTDIKHVFSCNPLYPAYRPSIPASGDVPGPLTFTSFEAGVEEVGYAGDGFSFDNESPRHRVFVEPFALADRLVTNGEFLTFVEDGGYTRSDLWLSLGWNAVNDGSWRHPFYWTRRDGDWHEFTLGGLHPLEVAAPVTHLSYFEADAFARWAGMRLPTEHEWEVAGSRAEIRGNFVDDGRYHPRADDGPRSAGPRQLFGDVWEWTSSSYGPYPGYAPPSGALGEYNGKFMCNQYVLRGGSCATSRDHVRATYRNFFPPEARWQFSGLRLARSETG